MDDDERPPTVRRPFLVGTCSAASMAVTPRKESSGSFVSDVART